MICSFVINFKPLEFGNKIKKYSLDRDIEYFLLNNGIDKKQLKYITISNFLTKDREIEEEKNYSIRFSSIDSKTTLEILKIFFYKRLTNETLKISNTTFLVSNIYHNNKYSKQLDLESFLENPLKDEITIKFLTPTFYKVGSIFIGTEDSRYFFKNILTKFKRSSIGNQFNIGNLDFSKVEIKEKNIKKVYIKTFNIEGIQGEITYKLVDDKDTKLKEMFNILGYFSEFSGVGHGCNKGYGQAIYII